LSPLARIFGILFAVFAIIWAFGYALIYLSPELGAGLGMILMLAGWGTGIFFILFLVMFILKR